MAATKTPARQLRPGVGSPTRQQTASGPKVNRTASHRPRIAETAGSPIAAAGRKARAATGPYIVLSTAPDPAPAYNGKPRSNAIDGANRTVSHGLNGAAS